MDIESKTKSPLENVDLVDHLAKLAQLRADGALTDEEFKALKLKLISEMNASKNETTNDRVRESPEEVYDDAKDENHSELPKKILLGTGRILGGIVGYIARTTLQSLLPGLPGLAGG